MLKIGAMTARRLVGRIFVIGFGFFFVFLSIKLLLGFSYYWSSNEDVFVCQDLFCLRPGIAHPFQMVSRSAGGNIVSLYSCELHNLAKYERLNPFDRPTPISFLMASSLIFVPVLLVLARFRRVDRNLNRGVTAGKLQSQETLPQPTILAALDKAADQAAGSFAISFRRLIVNGSCMAVLITPVAVIADMKLPLVGNITLAIAAIFVSVVLWRVSKAIEKDYPEVDEIRELSSNFTYRLFIKRVVDWGAMIYSLAGFGYLVTLVFGIKL